MKTLASILAWIAILFFFAACWGYFSGFYTEGEVATRVGFGGFIFAAFGMVALFLLAEQGFKLAQISFIAGLVLAVLNFFIFLTLRSTAVVIYPLTADSARAIVLVFGITAFIAGSLLLAASTYSDVNEFFN